MGSIDNILEGLSYKKLFKEEIKFIWKILSKGVKDNNDVKIIPEFSVATSGKYEDFSELITEYSYKWDLKSCRVVKKVKDFLVFGIDAGKIEIQISESIIRKKLADALYLKYRWTSFSELDDDKNIVFCNFYKNALNNGVIEDNSNWISGADVDLFFESDEFNKSLVGRYYDLVEKAYKESIPFKGRVNDVGEDIIPLVYYSIPRRTCYYLLRTRSSYFFAGEVKLDYRVLSGKSFGSFELEDFPVGSALRPGVPRGSISNNMYTFGG